MLKVADIYDQLMSTYEISEVVVKIFLYTVYIADRNVILRHSLINWIGVKVERINTLLEKNWIFTKPIVVSIRLLILPVKVGQENQSAKVISILAVFC